MQTEEITVNIRHQGEKVFKESLLFCAGDTPASALLGGFKESVSAHRLCRQCMTTKHEWRNNFAQQNFVLRDAKSHAEHIAAVSEPNLLKNVADFWKKRYSVKIKVHYWIFHILTSLLHCHKTQCTLSLKVLLMLPVEHCCDIL